MPISQADNIRLPAEWEPHACCWMAWAVHREWGAAADEVKRELREVIATIAAYEPVRLLTQPDPVADAKRQSFGGNVDIVPAPVDDIWMRDIAPTFAWRLHEHNEEPVAIDWNFNGWGGTKERPPRKGDGLARATTSVFGVPRISMPFVAEGGAVISDGEGTLITTRSCLPHPNRNPVRHGEDRQRIIEAELVRLGINRVIWLEGDPCEPITSGHVDGYVLLAPSGQALMDGCGDEDVEPPMWREHDFAMLEMR